MPNQEIEEYPRFLQSYENLREHFEEHFEDSSSGERGDRFVDFVHKLIPLTETGKDFPDLKVNPKKTHDLGVDLFSGVNRNGDKIFVQSKYKVRKKEDLDSVISKFQNLSEGESHAAKSDLFAFAEDRTQYMLITSSRLDLVISKYASSNLSSTKFFRKLESEKRIHLLKGDDLLEILRTLYKKSHLVPQDFKLYSRCGWINSNSVYVGIVGTKEVSQLYKDHGDALFFENIREFLGIDKSTNAKDRDYVNKDIVATLTNTPEQMLAKNNGLTIKASAIKNVDDKVITVFSGAVVNGCQTTNCIFRAGSTDVAEVLVKVVVSEDGWEVAKSANYQNPVARIDLDIAKYVRPALVQKYAASIGFDIKTESEGSVSGVIGRIYRNLVNYEAIRTLFLGIFSKKPNNMFQNNYTELDDKLVGHVFEQLDIENDLFRVLFIAVTAGDNALNKCREDAGSNSDVPTRIFDENKHPYRMLLLVLALCACNDIDISSKQENMQGKVEMIIHFLSKSKVVIESNSDLFHRMYRGAFIILSETYIDIGDVEKAQKDFYGKVARLDFSATLKKIRLRDRLA